MQTRRMDKFVLIFRDEIDIATCGKEEISHAIETIEFLNRSYIAGIGMKTLLRQSQLTEAEIKSLPERSAELIEKLESVQLNSNKKVKVSIQDVVERLKENEKVVIQRLFDGVSRIDICHELGIPYKQMAYQRFIEYASEKGIFVDKIKEFNKIIADIYRGKSFAEVALIHRKYFSTEEDVKEFLLVHDIPLDIARFKTEKRIGSGRFCL